jgi:hypothetical protein
MDIEHIDKLFAKQINKRGIGRELNESDANVWKLRNREVTLGRKLEVLYTLDFIRFKDGWDTD